MAPSCRVLSLGLGKRGEDEAFLYGFGRFGLRHQPYAETLRLSQVEAIVLNLRVLSFRCLIRLKHQEMPSLRKPKPPCLKAPGERRSVVEDLDKKLSNHEPAILSLACVGSGAGFGKFPMGSMEYLGGFRVQGLRLEVFKALGPLVLAVKA